MQNDKLLKTDLFHQSPIPVEPPKLYHYVKASGLVKAELLDEFLRKFESGGLVLTENIATNSFDRKHSQHPARLRYSVRYSTETAEEEKPLDSSDASLDGETVNQDCDVTIQDRRFAEELVRCGLLNDWQAQQLLDGRTKFTLGDYRIFDAIGHGGYGHVFLGHAEQGGGDVAIKVLPLAKVTPELTERFLHEIEVQKNLDHPNLVRYFGSGRDGNVHYMVHEFVDGGDLRELFRKEGVLPIEIVAPILGQIAQGVHYLHENGIIHRDLKPANVLLSSEGKAKLTDMGLAVPFERNFKDPMIRIIEESNLLEHQIDSASKVTGRVAGTVDYMAPDQIRNPSEPTPGWDIYSLGCTLYQMLTGSLPYPNGDVKQKFSDRIRFDPKDPRILNQTIPFDLVDLLRGMLAREPYDRITTAKEVANRLEAWSPPDGFMSYLEFL
ncbi:MAG: serine/threonine protein kinase [Planctomycetaceae bacterium]|nr:serine/threonine protein kinase [Planctomycetaceae bacterium]